MLEEISFVHSQSYGAIVWSADKLMKQCDWLLALLLITGVAVYSVGWSLNALVLSANGGSMPIVGEPDVLVNEDGRSRHYAVEGSDSLLFLSDCIRIDFPKVRKRSGALWGYVYMFAEWLDYPLEGGLNMVSIGDILRWSGAALFLLMIPPVLLRIPFRLANDGIRYRRSRRARVKPKDRT